MPAKETTKAKKATAETTKSNKPTAGKGAKGGTARATDGNIGGGAVELQDSRLQTLDGLKWFGSRLDENDECLRVGVGRAAREALSYREYLMDLFLRIRK